MFPQMEMNHVAVATHQTRTPVEQCEVFLYSTWNVLQLVAELLVLLLQRQDLLLQLQAAWTAVLLLLLLLLLGQRGRRVAV